MRDPSNEDGVHRYLAIVDFEAISQDPHVDPQKASYPLLDYLSHWGGDDPARWQVEMVIAQYLASRGLKSQSQEWARSALDHAPQTVRPQIHRFVDQLSRLLTKDEKGCCIPD